MPGIVRVTATAGNTGPVDYPSVKAAFDAINAGTHQGAIDVAILSDTTEVASAVLNASGAPSSYTSILVHPSGGIARTVSGAIVAGSPLINLNGATNVTINGLNTAAIRSRFRTRPSRQLPAQARSASSTAHKTIQSHIARCWVRQHRALRVAGGNILISTSTAWWQIAATYFE